MFKVVTLYKRKAGMDVAAFQQRWLDKHSLIAARTPGLRRYVQSHALPQGYKKGELIYDGISEMWFDTELAYLNASASDAFSKVLQDADAFIDASKTVVMTVDVHVIKDGAIPVPAVKNIEFVNQRPGMDLHAFRRYWKEVHGPIASKIEVLQRYEQNHLRLQEYDAPNRPLFDGLAITWFHSTADMKQGATTEAYAITRADEPHFLPDGHLPIIVATEHVIVR
jgi:uncharacterized protein (TIGR02118 family)